MKRGNTWILFVLLLVLFSCSKKEKQESATNKSGDKKAYRQNIKMLVDLVCYDQYTYEIDKLKGSLIGPNIVAAPFSSIQNAYSVRTQFLGKDVEPMINGYYMYDIPGNLVLMKVSGPPISFTKHSRETKVNDILYSLDILDGKLTKLRITCDSTIVVGDKKYFRIKETISDGMPLFKKNHLLAGVVTTIANDGIKTSVLIPSQELFQLISKLPKKVERIAKLRFKTDRVYPKAKDVDHFNINTTHGSFSIRLSDALPEYQNNFIRLASDGYYDSLLVHRVLHKFLVQMGASDTKFAKDDDPVGWKGPGYTLPTKIIPELFHKRGAIAASKLPDYKNPNNRSDGSQFYVVCGRTFTDEELNDIEEQKDFRFTKEQRTIYKTLGGAPYLDGDYTVFGEVIKGMDVLDAISLVPTKKDDRPMQNIRITNIELVLK